MPDPQTPVVPAQPAAETPTPTISASRDAANKGDYSAFNDAHLAGKRGTPLAEVPIPVPEPPEPPPPPLGTPKPTEEAKQVSKRQQQINDYERKIAEQNERIARLEAASRPAAPRSEPKADPAPTPKPAPAFGSYDDWIKTHPDAPYEDYMEARTLARVRHEIAEENRLAREAYDREQAVHAQTRIGQEVNSRLQKARDNKIDVDALMETPLPIDPSMPGFDAVSGILARSEVLVELMQHFVAHPDEAVRIAQMPPGVAASHLWRLEGRVERAAAATEQTPSASPPASTSTITAAPPPPPTLSRPASSTDPKASALARGDWNAFNQAEIAERVAKRTR